MRTIRRQAFRQAPWRLRIRWTGGAALPVVALLIVAGIYLAVSSKTATAGREVLTLDRQRSELLRAHEQLSTTLAGLTSPGRMMERAAAMGFQPAEPLEIEYLVVEGYAGEPEFEAPLPPASSEIGAVALSPAFTETWGEWLSHWLAGGTRASP